jgi:uncharacterized protein (DUF1330 family)
MPKGYWIVQTDISDQAGHQKYVEANRDVLRRHGAKMLVRSERREIVEGHVRSRYIVLEFPDYETALACYHSADYQEARKLRLSNTIADFAIVEGFEPS